MTLNEILRLQQRVGTTADGFWGPKSIAACQAYLRAMMPKVNPWPASDQASLQAFYGSPGDESKLVNLAAPVPMEFEGRRIKTIRVHVRCAESLERVLIAAYKVAPSVLGDYAGCYANRPMRGTSNTPSLHARGAAIDFWAGKNGLHTAWPTGAVMPIEVMECFAREGWLSAGAFWGRDAMHFQATR